MRLSALLKGERGRMDGEPIIQERQSLYLGKSLMYELADNKIALETK
jgi:hypothetical protein